MPLFVCEECGCVDNTACGGTFWEVLTGGGRVLCCECRFGKWHDKFPKEIATQNEVEEIRKYWKDRLPLENYKLVYKEDKNEERNEV